MSSDPSASFGPVVVRRRLGSALRRLREHAGLRLEQAAAELEVSPSKISRLETGHSIAKTWDVRNLLEVYGVEDPGRREELLRWVEESKAVGWWHPFSDAVPVDLDYYISLESEAAAISQFSPTIPGLLQTNAYAHGALAELLEDVQDLGKRELNVLADIRTKRQEILTREDRPLGLEVVLDEAGLLRPVGSQDVLREQLAKLLTHKDNVKIRVRPSTAPIRRFAMSPFAIFYPRLSGIDRTVVNIEAAGRDYYVEEVSETAQFETAFRVLWNDSLDQQESRDLIQSLIV